LVVSNPPPVCSPLRADLTSSAITAGSTPGLTFTYWTNAGATTAYATPSSAGEGTYYIKGTLGSQCFDIKPVIVTISTFVEANAGTGGHICSRKFKLNAVLTAGTGTWTKMSGPGNAVFTPDNHRPDADVEVDQVGTYDFSWTTGINACASTDIIRVIFHDLPSIDISTGIDATICKGENIQLHAEGTGFFSWAPPLLFNNPYISDPVAAPEFAETLTVTLTDQFGCKKSADIRVDVIDKPIADGGPDQTLVSISGTTMEAVLYNVADKGIWSLISGTGEFLDPTYEETSLDGLSTGKNSFLWTVTNGVCPASADTVLILVGDMIIPTLITPNLDGRNDYFIIGESGAKGRLELIIFDRRGALVYKNLNYDNLWNGDDYNKNPLPEDTYFYVLKTANNKSNTGYIVIRR
jgi:gliding motility-associated-like protein